MEFVRTESKVQIYMDIYGYKVIEDDPINPGRYRSQIIDEVNKPHEFGTTSAHESDH